MSLIETLARTNFPSQPIFGGVGGAPWLQENLFLKPDTQWWHHDDDKHNDDKEPEPVPEPVPEPEPVPAADPAPAETDPHYNPADEIYYSLNHCDFECKVTVSIHMIVMMIHLWTNGEQMGGWARGNLFLLMNTGWFLTLFSFNMALASEYPSFLDLPSWKRKVPYGIALITMIYFTIGLVSLSFKLTAGETIADTMQEIIFAYILWLMLPAAVESGLYMFLVG